jgi:hypothetical protein
MKTLKIEIAPSTAKGKAWVLRVDGQLKGIYGTKAKLRKALAEVMDVVE